MPWLPPTLPARPSRRALPALLALALPLALAACDNPGATHQFPPDCPRLALLKDGADITRFAPHGQDVTDMIVDGHLTAVPATCTWGPHGSVAASLKVSMDLTRGPAAQSRSLDVPYFVAVTRAGQVVDKQVYVMRADFPPNANRMSVTSDPVELNFPISAKVPPGAYGIFVSFQLTPAELAANRNRGTR